ncbi:MAG TPA: membrane dipeptidase [Thermoleophilaceae bacterium]
MISDFHSHYPLHLVPEARGDLLDLITTPKGRHRLRDRIRALLVGLASRFGNYRSFESGPRVTVPQLQAGGFGVAWSVLYSFFDEVDLSQSYGAPPQPGYVEDLLSELDLVEEEIATHHAGAATVARNPAELDAALVAGQVALVHCVEGGYHLGATPQAIDAAVTQIARRGVAYVILAHLFWRRVATNANAVPFIPDPIYRFVFPQPSVGLSELGEAAVRAMVRERVLIDVSHMSERARARTLELLDEIDPAKSTPLLASHAGYRFGKQEYNLTDDEVRAIAARDGVIGLIFAQHQLLDGLRKRTTTFDESFEAICAHIDKIRDLTGSHRHVGLGSDFDGFIKPTLGGLESAADMAQLEAALVSHYGAGDGAAICSGNALRLLRSYWRGKPA